MTAEHLFPLIRGYWQYHQAGLIVGRPDWRRIILTTEGLVMPDPACLHFLVSPEIQLWQGLLNCRPPEDYLGQELTPAGDMYYLGLLIYLAFSGNLPYLLENSWPTRAVLKGRIIDLGIHCPAINPMLAVAVHDLLNPDPEKRFTSGQLVDLWLLALEQKKVLAPPAAQETNLRRQRSFRHRLRLRKSLKSSWVKTAAVTIILMAGITGLFPVGGIIGLLPGRRPAGNSPLAEVRRFYQTMAGPPEAADVIRYNRQVGKDLLQAKADRIKDAAELLTRPLAEVKSLTVISQTADQVSVLATVKQWDWRNRFRREIEYREKLVLQKEKQGWKIRQRERLGVESYD